ncbi:MAG: hypothetical protein NVS4B8_24850 [Herpetosiphon sp.]
MLWKELALPWQCAIEEAWTAYCAGSLPIGAVVANDAGQIIARGRNRIFEKSGPPRTVYGSRVAHAEINALAQCNYDLPTPESCVLYTTLEPCPMCTGAIRMCLVGEVRYGCRDGGAGNISLLDASPFMKRRSVRLVGPADPTLEAVILALMVAAFLRSGQPPTHWVITAWNTQCPQAGVLGQAAYTSGWLQQLVDAQATAAMMIDTLATEWSALVD